MTELLSLLPLLLLHFLRFRFFSALFSFSSSSSPLPVSSPLCRRPLLPTLPLCHWWPFHDHYATPISVHFLYYLHLHFLFQTTTDEESDFVPKGINQTLALSTTSTLFKTTTTGVTTIEEQSDLVPSGTKQTFAPAAPSTLLDNDYWRDSPEEQSGFVADGTNQTLAPSMASNASETTNAGVTTSAAAGLAACLAANPTASLASSPILPRCQPGLQQVWERHVWQQVWQQAWQHVWQQV